MADLVTLGEMLDRRKQGPHKTPGWSKKITFFTDNGAHAEQSVALPFNGILKEIEIILPTTTDTSSSSTVTIDTPLGTEIYNSDSLAENSKTPHQVDILMVGTYTISLDMDKDPTTNGVSNVVVLRGL